MSLETLPSANPADLQAASQLAQDVHRDGVTELSEIDKLDDRIAVQFQESYHIPVLNGEGEPVGLLQAKNIGAQTIDAMGHHSRNPEDVED